MAIKIEISDKVGFAVSGVINDADGKEQPFDFNLVARRLDEDAINAAQTAAVVDVAKTGGHSAIVDTIVELVTNWSGVRDDTDAPLAYSPELLRQLIKSHKGLGVLIWRAYVANCGAKEKN